MTHHPTRRARLQAAADFVAACKQAGASPFETILRLIDEHGATHTVGASTNSLRIAGLTVTCTWSKDKGLLDAWARRVTLELMKLDGRCS